MRFNTSTIRYLAGITDEHDWLEGHRSLVKKRFCINRINQIDGLECQIPGGGFYLFVRITEDLISSDKEWVLDLLHEFHVLVVHGSGFSPQYGKGHFRMVCLPDLLTLEESFNRMESFISNRSNSNI